MSYIDCHNRLCVICLKYMPEMSLIHILCWLQIVALLCVRIFGGGERPPTFSGHLSSSTTPSGSLSGVEAIVQFQHLGYDYADAMFARNQILHHGQQLWSHKISAHSSLAMLPMHAETVDHTEMAGPQFGMTKAIVVWQHGQQPRSHKINARGSLALLPMPTAPTASIPHNFMWVTQPLPIHLEFPPTTPNSSIYISQQISVSHELAQRHHCLKGRSKWASELFTPPQSFAWQQC